MRREGVLCFFLLVCVTWTCGGIISSQGDVKEDNEVNHDGNVDNDWRECTGQKRTTNCLRYLVHRMKNDSKIRTTRLDHGMDQKKIVTTIPMPQVIKDWKTNEFQPKASDSHLVVQPHEFAYRPLERTLSTPALSSSYGSHENHESNAASVNGGAMGEDGRSFSTSYVLKVLLPLIFSFKQHMMAVAIFFVLLAIKKTIIFAAILIPILNKMKINGHYITDVKFPRAHEHEHVYIQQNGGNRLSAQPLDHVYVQHHGGNRMHAQPQDHVYVQHHGGNHERAQPQDHVYVQQNGGNRMRAQPQDHEYVQQYGGNRMRAQPQDQHGGHPYEIHEVQWDQTMQHPVGYQYYVLPEVTGPQTYVPEFDPIERRNSVGNDKQTGIKKTQKRI